MFRRDRKVSRVACIMASLLSLPLPVHLRGGNPLPRLVLLPDRKARDSQVVRDVVDDEGAEPRVGEERYRKSDVDEKRRPWHRVLDQWWSVIEHIRWYQPTRITDESRHTG